MLLACIWICTLSVLRVNSWTAPQICSGSQSNNLPQLPTVRSVRTCSDLLCGREGNSESDEMDSGQSVGAPEGLRERRRIISQQPYVSIHSSSHMFFCTSSLALFPLRLELHKIRNKKLIIENP